MEERARQWLATFVYLAAVSLLVFLIDTHHRTPSSSTMKKKKVCPNLPLHFNGGTRSFKILQVADLHHGSGRQTTRCRDVPLHSRRHCSDRNSTQFLKNLIALERPDLIAFTGDNIFGSSTHGSLEASLVSAFSPALEAGIPWAAVLGNHDHEGLGLASRLEIMFFTSLLDYSLNGGDGKDYIVPVFGSVNGTTPMMELFFMDSGHRAVAPDGRATYGYISRSQLEWLTRVTTGSRRNKLGFFHIPIPEMGRRFRPGNVVAGRFQEGVACSAVDTGVLGALRALGGVRAVFVGHDHLNDFCGDLDGIWFCYGGGFGYHGYGRVGWDRRARVVEARLDRTRTRLESIRTWKRLDDLNLTPIDHLSLWEEKGLKK